MTDENNVGATTYVPGRYGVVSLGLMGGSFAKAFAAAGAEVYAWNRTRSTLELAMIETVTGELDEETIPTCELIILAGYPASTVEWLERYAPLVSPGAIVIDTVGVKRVICERCEEICAPYPFTFVGCHPMAGTQYSGFARGRSSPPVSLAASRCRPQTSTTETSPSPRSSRTWFPTPTSRARRPATTGAFPPAAIVTSRASRA